MNVLVVGGAGYIGSHTVRALEQCGHTCVVLDNLTYGHAEALAGSTTFVRGDILSKDDLEAVFSSHNIDAVIHFAAFAYVGESVAEPSKYYKNNVSGTMNLLDAMLNASVKKIVFSSTCATYGEPQYTPIDEKHPQEPINPYGRSKLMVEQIFSDYEKAYGLRHISLRYFNAAGASLDGLIGESHEPETHLIPLVLKAIKGERECVKVFGQDYDTPDGTCQRDYIHVEDLAEAHMLALGKLDTYTGCINLGTGVPTSVKEIVKSAEEVTGLSCPVQPAPRRPGDPARLYAANALAEEILGWTPKHTSIETILRTAWQWEQNKRY